MDAPVTSTQPNTSSADSVRSFEYRSIPLPILIPVFYAAYTVMALLGNVVIEYIPISPKAWFVAITYAASISVGAFLGYALHYPRVRFLPLITSKTYQRVGLVVAMAGIAVGWGYMIARYGSLGYIFSHAGAIRAANIGGRSGQDLSPAIYGYMGGLAYGVLAVSLARYAHYRKRWDLLLIASTFLLIVISDMRTFGRNGIVFAIFCIVAFAVVYRIRIFSLRNVVLVLCLFVILSAPRLIRGSFDNFSGTVGVVAGALRVPIPSSLNSVLSAYIYYFSAPYAFADYVATGGMEEPLTYGLRSFTPVVRLFNRLAGNPYVSTIDPMANVPFQYNIYSVVKDLYQDFGLIGMTLAPLLAGVFFGIWFRWKGVFHDALKMMVIGWIFFSPLYNIFSFGAPMIGFATVLAATFLWKDDRVQQTRRRLRFKLLPAAMAGK